MLVKHVQSWTYFASFCNRLLLYFTIMRNYINFCICLHLWFLLFLFMICYSSCTYQSKRICFCRFRCLFTHISVFDKTCEQSYGYIRFIGWICWADCNFVFIFDRCNFYVITMRFYTVLLFLFVYWAGWISYNSFSISQDAVQHTIFKFQFKYFLVHHCGAVLKN